MVKNDYWMLKAPLELKRKLDWARIERIKQGKDKKMVSYKRLLLAASRHDNLINDLARADFIEDKKAEGSVFGIFTFMITALLIVLFFAGLIYAQGLIAGVFHDAGVMNDARYSPNSTWVNMTAASDMTFGQQATAIQALKMVAAVYILALAIAMIITNALVRIHPLWFFAYVLLSFLAIVFSVPIANAYESIYTSNIFGGTLQGFSVANWILLHLPIVVLIMTILGGVFLFINMIRSGNEGEFR